MPVKVSIIVPCMNEGETIHLLLRAIQGQSFPIDEMEVVIADGMSRDDTRQKIRAFQEENPEMQIRVIDNTKLIIPSALNAAIKSSKGETLIRMDAHSIPRPDYVARCVEALEQGIGDNVGGVWDIRPLIETPMAQAIAVAAAHPLGVGGAQYRFTQKAAYVDTVPFGSFKRSLLDKVGMFDESLLANEDYEFNTRIRQHGGKIWLDPNIRSIYYARKNLRDLRIQYYRYGFWKAQMAKRYPRSLRLRQLLPPLFLASLFIFSVASFFWMYAPLIVLTELALYLLALVLVGIQLAIKHMKALHILNVPLAIATMHLNWGAGFIRGIFYRQPKKNEKENND